MQSQAVTNFSARMKNTTSELQMRAIFSPLLRNPPAVLKLFIDAVAVQGGFFFFFSSLPISYLLQDSAIDMFSGNPPQATSIIEIKFHLLSRGEYLRGGGPGLPFWQDYSLSCRRDGATRKRKVSVRLLQEPNQKYFSSKSCFPREPVFLSAGHGCLQRMVTGS